MEQCIDHLEGLNLVRIRMTHQIVVQDLVDMLVELLWVVVVWLEPRICFLEV